MRRKYIEKYSFFKWLQDITLLPDSCTSLPYYFQEFNNIDVFVTFQRQNNPLRVTCFVYKKDISRRNSFGNTVMYYNFEVDLEILKLLLFDPQIRFLNDFLIMSVQNYKNHERKQNALKILQVWKQFLMHQ